jgi:uncharacterized protein YdhG (YjbR/CyaY superfamily)
MTAKKDKQTTAEKSKGFDEVEKAAMKERAKELKAEARASKDKEAGEKDVITKISEMTEPDRSMAERFHAIIKATAPELSPKTWYGMPSYANKEGKIICFFQAAEKFSARYATIGFNDVAMLDDGNMWATAFAITELTSAEEAKIVALVKKALG